MEKKINRTLNNLASVPAFNTILTKEEVDYLLDTHADIIFCRGMLRQICFDFITDNRCKVYTKAI